MQPLEEYQRRKEDREFARQVAPLHELIRALDCGPCRIHRIHANGANEVRLVVSCSPANDLFELNSVARIIDDVEQ